MTTPTLKEEKNKLESYMKFWPLVALISTIIAGWANINGELKYQDARIKSLEARSDASDKTLGQVASDVAFIRGTLEAKK